MAIKHTPAPWRVQGNTPLMTDVTAHNGSVTICKLVGHPEFLDNAKLIELSPQMYDLLKRLAQEGTYLNKSANLIEEARALLDEY